MAQIETWYNQDLQQPVKVHYLDGSLFSHNSNGNRIGVHVFNNGEPVTLSGTVSGYVVTADGSTVPCTGTRSGNSASILIPAAAYQPGAVFITLFITDGTTVTTLASVSTSVLTARTNNQIDPGSVVTDWTQTVNAAMQSVETAAENLGGIIAVPYANITYPVPLGKYTYYEGNLYRCISPIATSESFTAAHWTQVRLGDDVSDLKSAITNFKSDITRREFALNTYIDTKFNITERLNQYINGVGSYQSSNGYNSYEFQAEEQTEIYFSGTFAYLTMAVYSATPISSDTIIGSRMKESTIPTEENPYTVDVGNYVVITVYSDPLAFYSDYRNYQIEESALGSVYASAFRVNTQYDTDFSLTAKLGKYTGSNGAYIDNSGYNSYEIIGTENTQIYFDTSNFDYLSLCVYNGTPSSATIIGSRMRGTDLPTLDNPYSLSSGYYAVISIQNSDTLSFYSNYKNIVLNNKVRLASNQIQQVKDSLDTNLTRLYVTNDIQSDHITISMYTQIAGDKKFRVDLYKYVYGTDIQTANANSNVWVMGGAYITDNAFSVLETVILPLEWDCAIKEVGASDFMGGKQHGDEIYDAYYIYADGKILDPTQSLTPFYCDAIELVQTSKLNRVGQPTDYLLKHSKHIKITPKNVFCEQSFKALQTFQVNLSYSAMLPIAPTYADAFIRNGKAELEDINSDSYTVTTTRGNKVWANIVSDDGLIRFEADSNSDMIPAFAITKGTNDRKCYYTMNADNGTWEENKLMYSNYNFSFDVN